MSKIKKVTIIVKNQPSDEALSRLAKEIINVVHKKINENA